MDLTGLDIEELQNLIEEYPWYAGARREYVLRCSDEGEESLMRALRESALFIPSCSELMREARLRHKPVKKFEPAPEVVKPKIYVVGGDYFGKEDFRELEADGLSFNVSFGFDPEKEPAKIFDSLGDAPQGYENYDFCTETLAKVYEEQQFYDKAIEVYNQLILLYPEKSAYFALLIEKIKNIKI